MNSTIYLFSYGTLQLEEIQLETFGRKPVSRPDAIVGYRLTLLPILDEAVRARLDLTHYRNLEYSGKPHDIIDGTVLSITADELERVDVYEADAEYERVEVELKSGVRAWVYLKKEAV